MNTFYIVENNRKPRAAEYGCIIEKYLLAHGGACKRRSGNVDLDDFVAGIDCIITLGGDGTLIKAASDTAGYGIPIIGVNLGHLGYLTTVKEEEEIPKMLDALLADDFSIENRMMIQGTWEEDGIEKTAAAFNEVVIGSKMSMRGVRLKTSIGGEFLNEYVADGIIVATPTGSTAYNLSAGGPIVESTADMMVLTPICPHALTFSSLVLSAENEIEVEIVEGDPSGQVAIFDGEVRGEISEHGAVKVSKSQHTVKLVTLKDFTFTGNLRKRIAEL